MFPAATHACRCFRRTIFQMNAITAVIFQGVMEICRSVLTFPVEYIKPVPGSSLFKQVMWRFYQFYTSGSSQCPLCVTRVAKGNMEGKNKSAIWPGSASLCVLGDQVTAYYYLSQIFLHMPSVGVLGHQTMRVGVHN